MTLTQFNDVKKLPTLTLTADTNSPQLIPVQNPGDALYITEEQVNLLARRLFTASLILIRGNRDDQRFHVAWEEVKAYTLYADDLKNRINSRLSSEYVNTNLGPQTKLSIVERGVAAYHQQATNRGGVETAGAGGGGAGGGAARVGGSDGLQHFNTPEGLDPISYEVPPAIADAIKAAVGDLKLNLGSGEPKMLLKNYVKPASQEPTLLAA